MNGYDFELEFSGTVLDFEELKDSFQNAGVDDTQVSLFLKNELGSREKKIEEIDALFEWLRASRNEEFDLEEFLDGHREALKKAVNIIIVNGPFTSGKEFRDVEIDIDNVDAVDELKDTDLENTPIIFWIDTDNLSHFQRNLSQMLTENYVDRKQLFFEFSDDVDNEKACRMIEDLGVRDPQIVSSVLDEKIKNYITLYPITDYIHNTLEIFKSESSRIDKLLKQEHKRSRKSNKEVYDKMNACSERVSILKGCLDKFENRDNLSVSNSWKDDRQNLLLHINSWQNRKAKISNIENARKFADEYNNLVKEEYGKFVNIFSDTVRRSKEHIERKLKEWYRPASVIYDFIPHGISFGREEVFNIPDLRERLLSLNKEQNVKVKGLFERKSHIDRIVSYDLQKWRDYAENIVSNFAEDLQKRQFGSLKKYYDELSEAYIQDLRRLIKKNADENNELSARLSGKERDLQKGMDWISRLVYQLEKIERD